MKTCTTHTHTYTHTHTHTHTASESAGVCMSQYAAFLTVTDVPLMLVSLMASIFMCRPACWAHVTWKAACTVRGVH